MAVIYTNVLPTKGEFFSSEEDYEDLYLVWGDINNNESFSAIFHSNGTWGVGRVGQPGGSCKTFLDALKETEG